MDLPPSESERGKSKRMFAKLRSVTDARNFRTPALERAHLSAKRPSQSILSKLISGMMLSSAAAGSVPMREAGHRVFKSVGRNVTVCKNPHWCSESFLPSGGGVEEPLRVVEELNVMVQMGRRN